jgi:hypothetical protein
VTQQYYDLSGPGKAKRFVPYAIKNAGTIEDTHAYPSSGCKDKYKDFYTGQSHTLTSCLTAGQLFSELNQYIGAHRLPRGRNTEYFILTAPGVGSCDDSSNTNPVCAISNYCGWHSASGFQGIPSSQTIYADLPYISGTPCDIDYAESAASATQYPGLSTTPGIDAVVGVFSHELAESMTDPLENGWYGPGGGGDEIGDKCAAQYAVGQLAYGFTGLPQTASTAYYNAILNGSDYLLQMEFDNRTARCNQWDTDTQPTVAAISVPTRATSGVPASFSLATYTAPAGIAYVTWSFGDGTTSVSTSTAGAIKQSFPAGGSYSVTAILTDKHGNEVRHPAGPISVTQGSARLSVHLSNTHPAPKAGYTVKLAGFAIPGGTLGSGHNRTEVDLFEQPGTTCATSSKAERSRVSAGKASAIGRWFTGAGSFAYTQKRQASPSRHLTVHFCGYVSRSLSVADARATTFYTTT